MKRIEFIIVAVLLSTIALAQRPVDPITRSVFNCGFFLRQIVGFSVSSHTPARGGEVYADTIAMYSRKPYVSQVSETIMAYAKIGLGAYYVKADKPDSLNYDELYTWLWRARYMKKLHDLSYALCCLKVAQYCQENSLLRSASNMGKCYATANKDLFGENSDSYFESMYDASALLSLAGRHAEADSCLVFCQSYMEQHDSTSSDKYRQIIADRAEYRQEMGDDNTTLQLLNKLVALTAGNDEEHIHALLKRAGLYYDSFADYDKSNSDVTEALSLMSTSHLFLPYDVLNIFPLLNNPLTDKQNETLLDLVRTNYKPDDFITTALLSRAYQAVGKYSQADSYYEKAIRLAKLSDDGVAQGLSDDEMGYLQQLLISRCEYGLLAKFMEHAIDKTLDSKLKSTSVVYSMMSFLANIYSLDNNFAKANSLLHSLLKLNSVPEGERIQILNSLGDNELAIGNYDEAYRIGKMLTSSEGLSKERFLRVQSSLVVNSLISEIDLRRTNYQDIRQEGTDTLIQRLRTEVATLTSFVENYLGKNSPQYIEALMNTMAVSYLDNDIDKMATVAADCESLIRQLPNAKDRAYYLKALAPDYLLAKNYSKALELIRTKGDDRYSPMPWFDTLVEAEACLNLGKRKDAKTAFVKSADEIINSTLTSFTTLDEAGRDSYWRMYRQWLYDSGKYVEENSESEDFTGSLYNLALFSKGLLLHSKQEIERIVNQSGNPTLAGIYQRLSSIRTRLSVKSLSDADKKQLTEEARLCEDSVMRGCAAYGDYTRRLRSDWRELQKSLSDSAVAIEFIVFNTDEKTKCYAALLLQKDSNYPRFVRLFKENEIDSIASGDMINQKYSNLVWAPLLPYIKDKKNIYFSPSGLLNKIPIEYLPYDGREMASVFHMYRLSSTRELIDDSQPYKVSNAVVYGGLEYDATIGNVTEKATDGKRLFHFPYLDGTEQEASDIATIANEDRVGCTELTGVDGTEESFKSLSGRPFQLLHIGTHGFCKSFTTNYLDNMPFLMTNNMPKVEDKSLYYSALAMAGVNNAHLADETSNGNEGYLSAKEISLLDLHNVRLAVLSACNTNNGDVTGDGTFGLQRGFKLAGVKSLLMTAWSVDDNATRIFIKSFYENLLGGKSPSESVEIARAELRKVDNGKYNKPQYWAPFILLDGLE